MKINDFARTTQIVLLIVLGMQLFGCKQTLPITAPLHAANLTGEAWKHEKQIEFNQKYDLNEVKKRAKHLRRGMSKYHVLITLGSPAEKSYDKWVYRSSRAGLLLPTDRLHVQFQSGRYVRHGTGLVILGEDFRGASNGSV